MGLADIANISVARADFAAGSRTQAVGESLERSSAAGKKALRADVGEFVGNVFYGTLLQAMQSSTLKGSYMHGGRGEEVFTGQLHMELAKRMGQAPNDPIASRLFKAWTARDEGRVTAEQRGLGGEHGDERGAA